MNCPITRQIAILCDEIEILCNDCSNPTTELEIDSSVVKCDVCDSKQEKAEYNDGY